MNQRTLSALFLLVGSTLANFLSAEHAAAAQATTSDLTDAIVRLGGWFKDADDTGAPATNFHYWAQVTYTLQSSASASKSANPAAGASIPGNPGAQTANPSPNASPSANGPSSGASGSNITTLVKTETMSQAEAATGGISTPPAAGSTSPTVGAPCANGMTTTETVTLDLRELQPATAPAPVTRTIDEGRSKNNPTITVWTVNLTVNGGKKLIRVNTMMSPPTCKDAKGNAVALPGGKPVNSTTSQKDDNTYAIEFAESDQARYFQMLVNSVVPSLNPPRLNLAPLP